MNMLYGTHYRYRDVTDVIYDRCRDQPLHITNYNDIFGDPAPYEKKELSIRFNDISYIQLVEDTPISISIGEVLPICTMIYVDSNPDILSQYTLSNIPGIVRIYSSNAIPYNISSVIIDNNPMSRLMSDAVELDRHNILFIRTSNMSIDSLRQWTYCTMILDILDNIDRVIAGSCIWCKSRYIRSLPISNAESYTDWMINSRDYYLNQI